MERVSDQTVGQNVLTLRGNLSQQVLADEMRARGWRWSQATVWAVEKGERPLKLLEARDLAELLGTSVEWLFREPKVAQNIKRLHLAWLTANRRQYELGDAFLQFMHSQDDLRKEIDYMTRQLENLSDPAAEAEVRRKLKEAQALAQRTVNDVMGDATEHPNSYLGRSHRGQHQTTD